jgi:hypothetical protein
MGTLPVRRGMRGLGADYCRSNPPDPATIDLITKAGGTVNLIDCAYSTGARNETGVALPGTFLNPAAAGPQPVQNLPPEPQYEDCNPFTLGPAASTACAARNLAKQTAWQIAYGAAQANYNRAMCIWNGKQNGQDLTAYCAQVYPPGYSGSGTPLTTAIPIPGTAGGTAGGGSRATFSFVGPNAVGNPRSLNVGDKWSILIIGAQPNAPVTAAVSGPQNFSYQGGSTDGMGTFSTTGTATADLVGNWSETWYVGGQAVGSISFAIVGAAVPPAGGGAGGGASAPGSGSGSGSGGGSQSSGSGASNPPVNEFDVMGFLSQPILGIPAWGWGVAAVALFFIAGGHHR